MSLAQESPLLQNRYTNTPRTRHGSFHKGMARDIPTWEMPEGYCYDAVNLLCDRPGKIRKRGGTTSPASGNSAATVENIIGFKSNGIDGVTGLWGSAGKAGATITTFNTSTGATTAVLSDGSAAVFACRPFQHGNLVVFPFQALGTTTNDRNRCYFIGGGTGANFVPTTGTVTANDNRVTGVTASFTASHLGSLIEIDDSGGANTHYYVGRIVEVTSSSAVRVEPTPTASFTISSGQVTSAWSSSTFGFGDTTGRYGVSFQNRIVFLSTMDIKTSPTSVYAKGLPFEANRLRWTLLPTETPEAFVAGANMDGNNVMYPQSFTVTGTATEYNFQDIPNLGGGTALAAIGDGQLVIFGPTKMFILSGQLATETIVSPSFSWSVDQASNNVGCLAQRSIQYSQNGLIFAGNNNIYQYDGSSLKPLLQGTNAIYYQDRITAGDRPVGSAYALSRNSYIVCMNGTDTSSISIELDTNAVTRFTNVQLFDSTPDPSDASKLWGVGWWDTTAAAPTFVKGQLTRLDPIWLPAQANASDANGTAVLADYQSAAWDSQPLAANKMPADIQLSYDLRGTGSPTATVQMDTKLNTQDASFQTVTSTLPNTGSVALTKNITPAVPVIAEGPAVEFRITMNAAAASFELLGVDIGIQERPGMFST